MKYFLISALLFAQVSISLAQDEKEIVYVHTNRGRAPREYKTVDFYNVYKFDMTAMLTGQYKLGYERRISQKSSLEFELGATLSNVGIQVGHLGVSNGESRLGGTVTAAWRYYPLDEVAAFNKFYVSPKVSFRNYNSEYIQYDAFGYPTTESGQKGYENMTRFMLVLGKQCWISSTFSLDFYAGLGLGNTRSKYKATNYLYDQNTQTYLPYTQTYVSNNSNVVFECGLKLGIGN